MKEETKKKLCKISKIVGFAITFGFAVFGALCAAMLIGNGSKKDDIKTLGSSLVLNEVRSERNIKPRKAPDFSNAENLFNTDNAIHDVYFYESYASPNANYDTYLMDLAGGYYYFCSDYDTTASLVMFEDTLANVNGFGEYVGQFGWGTHVNYSDNGYMAMHASGLGWSKGRYIYVPSGGRVLSISFPYQGSAYLYLVDTLQVPASSYVYLGDNWNPLKAFGDTLSEKGGYLLTEETWTYGSQTYKSLVISGLVFRYEGVVYDRIQMHAKPLNALHYPYVDSSGTIVESPSTQNSGPNEVYVLDYVGFAQSWLDDGTLPVSGVLRVMVGGKADTPSSSGKLPYNGSLQWVTSSRTIEIIDNNGSTTGRYNNRFSYMTDLEFVNMLAEYESEPIDVVNSGQMFGLFTNAFDSLLPILSISILPNISLGMLLFIPLIGAIIVIIIRVVKK